MIEPVHIISLGAGVQSSTMALMATEGQLSPMPVAAVFADTGDEPDSVYKWLDYLEKLLAFPVIRVTKGKLSERELKVYTSKKSGKRYRKSGIPAFTSNKGMLWRKCTTDFKITPIIRAVRVIAKIPRYCKEVRAIQWIGISSDEAHRMKPSRLKYIEHIWPLVDKGMSRQDCLKWWSTRGMPQPPRSACIFCPYHNDKEWYRLKRDEPSEFEKAVKFERDMQEAHKLDQVSTGVPYLHRKMIPLDQVEFSSEPEVDHFGNECEGICGV